MFEKEIGKYNKKRAKGLSQAISIIIAIVVIVVIALALIATSTGNITKTGDNVDKRSEQVFTKTQDIIDGIKAGPREIPIKQKPLIIEDS